MKETRVANPKEKRNRRAPTGSAWVSSLYPEVSYLMSVHD